MNLYIVRHAEAVPLGSGGATTDADRPLTPEGLHQSDLLGRLLKNLALHPAAVLTSPLLRCRQTAEGILRHLNPPPNLIECDALAPGGTAKKLARALLRQEGDALILVGHQPDLTRHTAWLLGSKKAEVDYAKGAAALIICDGSPRKGAGSLRWLVTPKVLGAAVAPGAMSAVR